MIAAEYLAPLEDTEALFEAVKSLTDDQLAFRPSPEAWTLILLLEHIVMAESSTAKLVLSLKGKDGTDIERVGYGKLKHLLSKREQKVKAPSYMEPKGQITSVEEFKSQLIADRQELISTLKQSDFEFGSNTIPHPLLGELGGIDWLGFLASHTERHRIQILEIKAHSDFPKG